MQVTTLCCNYNSQGQNQLVTNKSRSQIRI